MANNQAIVDAPAPETAGLRAARRLAGKALRKDCPRSSHADVVLGQKERDPLALIEQSNEGRVEKLLPIRFTRMAESAFAFFRGTAVGPTRDPTPTPVTRIPGA